VEVDPAVLLRDGGEPVLDRGTVTDVHRYRKPPPAQRLDLAYHLAGRRPASPVGQRDVGAVPGQLQRDLPADAP
jgi:hypothetical protein